jgi:hypothetical protein
MSDEGIEGVDRKKAKDLIKATLVNEVANGWHIEIENGYEAVLSKKKPFNWIPHLVVILLGIFLFIPLAIFWPLVMIVVAVSRGTSTKRIWIDDEGKLQTY